MLDHPGPPPNRPPSQYDDEGFFKTLLIGACLVAIILGLLLCEAAK